MAHARGQLWLCGSGGGCCRAAGVARTGFEAREGVRAGSCIASASKPTLGVASKTNALARWLQVQCRTPLFLLLFLLVSARKAQTTLTRHVARCWWAVPGVCAERGHVTLDLVFDNGAGRAFGLSRFILSALVLDKYKLDACA
jgi:hypothetical protein